MDLAADCLGKAQDLSGLLLLAAAKGDRPGLTKLAEAALTAGKHNVAFVCLFLLGQVRRGDTQCPDHCTCNRAVFGMLDRRHAAGSSLCRMHEALWIGSACQIQEARWCRTARC